MAQWVSKAKGWLVNRPLWRMARGQILPSCLPLVLLSSRIWMLETVAGTSMSLRAILWTHGAGEQNRRWHMTALVSHDGKDTVEVQNWATLKYLSFTYRPLKFSVLQTNSSRRGGFHFKLQSWLPGPYLWQEWKTSLVKSVKHLLCCVVNVFKGY